MQRDSDKIFHLAIPTTDLDAAREFYVEKLGCEIGRTKDDRITLNFFGDQVVCHLTDESEVDDEPKMYPRHFGVTFKHREEFDRVLKRAEEKGADFFQEEFVRFPGQKDEHRTFFLVDPDNNLLEFKWYNDPAMAY